MALRGIREYMARGVNNIFRVEDEHRGQYILVSPKKESSNTIIIIIYIGLCVSILKI